MQMLVLPSVLFNTLNDEATRKEDASGLGEKQ